VNVENVFNMNADLTHDRSTRFTRIYSGEKPFWMYWLYPAFKQLIITILQSFCISVTIPVMGTDFFKSSLTTAVIINYRSSALLGCLTRELPQRGPGLHILTHLEGHRTLLVWFFAPNV